MNLILHFYLFHLHFLKLLKKAGGDGGVIVVDNKGQLSWVFNTEGMYRAQKTEGGKVLSEIFAGSN